MRVAWVVLGLMIAACVVETPPPAAPPPPADPEPKPELESQPPVASEPIVHDDPGRQVALESGFEHCCGDERYRLEIGCGYLEMRCYVRTPEGSWRRTYGRHCKRELGLACYLNGCDDLCD